jgi:hypothetical protein
MAPSAESTKAAHWASSSIGRASSPRIEVSSWWAMVYAAARLLNCLAWVQAVAAAISEAITPRRVPGPNGPNPLHVAQADHGHGGAGAFEQEHGQAPPLALDGGIAGLGRVPVPLVVDALARCGTGST